MFPKNICPQDLYKNDFLSSSEWGTNDDLNECMQKEQGKLHFSLFLRLGREAKIND